jgi:hypothetical protein
VKLRAASASRNQGRQARTDHRHGDSVQREPRRAGRAHRALVNEKIITEISAMRDESDENTRVVIELKRDATPRSSSTIS